eukprot:863799-Amorphochlora_amoeboformis.AAC.1
MSAARRKLSGAWGVLGESGLSNAALHITHDEEENKARTKDENSKSRRRKTICLTPRRKGNRTPFQSISTNSSGDPSGQSHGKSGSKSGVAESKREVLKDAISNAELSELYSQCIKLATANKGPGIIQNM